MSVPEHTLVLYVNVSLAIVQFIIYGVEIQTRLLGDVPKVLARHVGK